MSDRNALHLCAGRVGGAAAGPRSLVHACEWVGERLVTRSESGEVGATTRLRALTVRLEGSSSSGISNCKRARAHRIVDSERRVLILLGRQRCSGASTPSAVCVREHLESGREGARQVSSRTARSHLSQVLTRMMSKPSNFPAGGARTAGHLESCGGRVCQD